MKRMWEIYYLVSMRCWRIQPFQNEKNRPFQNGKGNEDEVHHVPAPSLTFHLERKPILMIQPHQRPSMSIKAMKRTESIAPARRLNLAAVKGNHQRGRHTSTTFNAAGFQDGCIRQKGAAQRNRVGRKLAEIYYESNSKKQALIPKSCTLLLFEVLREFDMERVNTKIVGEDGENGLPVKKDQHGGFNGSRKTRRSPGNDCRESRRCFTSMVVTASKRIILVKWIWNTLTHFLQVVRNTKKPCILGLNPSPPAEEKDAAQKDPQNGGKRPCSPFA